MFKVSQEIYVNASDSVNHSKTYGRYQRLDDDDGTQKSPEKNNHSIWHCPKTNLILTTPHLILGEFGANGPRSVFVAPELSEVRQVAVHHFPEVPISANVEFDFIIAKNGAHGNIAVKVS